MELPHNYTLIKTKCSDGHPCAFSKYLLCMFWTISGFEDIKKYKTCTYLQKVDHCQA